jgi:hypothetical protein
MYGEGKEADAKRALRSAIDYQIQTVENLYHEMYTPVRDLLPALNCGPMYLYSGQSPYAGAVSVWRVPDLLEADTCMAWTLPTFMSTSVCKNVAQNFAGKLPGAVLIRIIVHEDKYGEFPYIPLFSSDLQNHCDPHPEKYHETEVLLPPYLVFEKTRDAPATPSGPREIDVVFKGIAPDRPTPKELGRRARAAVDKILRLPPAGGGRKSRKVHRYRGRASKAAAQGQAHSHHSHTKKRHRHTNRRRR